MNARHACALASLTAVLLGSVACVRHYDIAVETPIRARIDVSEFDRVFVAGFIAGGTDDVDSNLETTRLLRSQLRTRSELRVIDADVLPLMEVARTAPADAAPAGAGRADAATTEAGRAEAGRGNAGQADAGRVGAAPGRSPNGGAGQVQTERDLESYKHVFTNVDYWRQVGEQHQQPLIVTGTILFTPQESNQLVNTQRESFDELGRRITEPTQELRERRGFVLQPNFVFIDGRTGTVLHSERFNESILYAVNNPTPALSSYFELMDRVLPGFLSTFSSQSIRGSRVLLR